MILQFRFHLVQSLANVNVISKLFGLSPLFADFENLTGKFNSIIVKTLKKIFCFFCDGVPFKLKKIKGNWVNNFSARIVRAFCYFP